MNKPIALMAVAALLAGCGSRIASPRDHYLKALLARETGDAAAYQQALLEVATLAPDSRAGRRARATLGGSDMLTNAYVVGILAAIAIPNFMKYQTRSRQSEAKATLRALALAQQAYKAQQGRYCKSFVECSVTPQPNSRYLYFMSPRDVMGGDGAQETEHLFEESMRLLEARNLQPGVTKTGFVIVAIGNIDGDAALDLWSIDAEGTLENLIDDVEIAAPEFGL